MNNQKLVDFISARIAHLTHVIDVCVPHGEDEMLTYAELLEEWKLELAAYQEAKDSLNISKSPSATDGWIKCSDRMPDIGDGVLIRIPVCDHFNIENAKYQGEGKFLGAWCSMRGAGCAYKVTEWMPLPAAPE